MNEAYREYLKAIQEKGADGTEFTYRTPFENLLNAVKPTDITFKVRHEPKRKKEFGAPDFLITSKGLPIGYIETKKLDEEVTDTRKTDQIARYLKVTPNLIITNYRDFLLIKDGVDVEKVSLFGYADASKKRAKISEDDVEKLERIFSAFFESKPIEIAKVSVLAEELARRAKLLKAFIEEELKSEEKKDYAVWLEGLFEEFKRNLIGDLDEEGFADAFTQTLIYGLLLAGLDKKEPLNRITAYSNIPRSFAVIHELFDFFSKHDPPERFDWIYDEIIAVINAADFSSIGGELMLTGGLHANDAYDAYWYFYEPFLKKIDAIQKKEKGVYYTPIPVVSFIIRSLDEILKNKFGVQSGFSNPKVTTLDFACGTGTFLAEIFKHVINGLKATHNEGQIPNTISEHILKNFYGFEYLVAPYAVAHLKLARLIEELSGGFTFGKDDRLQIFLTDTLNDSPHTSSPIFQAISKEGKEANGIKRSKEILVVTGNPPYNVSSKNKSEWLDANLPIYKPEGEKNIQPLSDDYVKFIRFAHFKMEKVERGVVGIITNNSFINGLIHRKMRAELLKTFDEIYILNLHGNARIGESAPDGGKDENVFDIMQGVCISFFVKGPYPKSFSQGESPHPKSFSQRESPHPKSFSQREKDFNNLPSPSGRGTEGEGFSGISAEGEAFCEEGSYRYSPKYITELARDLRKRQNEPEKIIWELLRNRNFHGLKFRRQHPIDRYIADFYCNELKLVIEVDGLIHEGEFQKEYDENRDEYMSACGCEILRIKTDEIYSNSETVIKRIEDVIFALNPHPKSFSQGENPHPKSFSQREKDFNNLPSPSGRGTEGEGFSGISAEGEGLSGISTEGEGYCKVFYHDLYGKRDDKFRFLRENDIDSVNWQELDYAAFDNAFGNTRWGKRFPYFKFFTPTEEVKTVLEYGDAWGMNEIFIEYASGVKTHRDSFVIDYEESKLKEKYEFFKNKNINEAASKLGLRSNRDWSMEQAQEKCKNIDFDDIVQAYHYRPFDIRKILYCEELIDWPRRDLMRHFLEGANVGFTFNRMVQDEEVRQFFAIDKPVDLHIMETGKQQAYVAPLYLYEEPGEDLFSVQSPHPKSFSQRESPHPKSFSQREKDFNNLPSPSGRGTEGEGLSGISTEDKGLSGTSADRESLKRPNFKKAFVEFIEGKYSAKPTPEQIFGYIYAILYCPTYREKYLELLKIDFPRVPFVDDEALFFELSALGWELAGHHLMRETYDLISNFPIAGSCEVEGVKITPCPLPNGQSPHPKSFSQGESPHPKSFSQRESPHPKSFSQREKDFNNLPSPSGRGTEGEGLSGTSAEGEGVRVWINAAQYFDNVPREVWDFYIGGYRVLDHWLKARKGRTLTNKDITTFHRIVSILDFTIAQMARIEELVGGGI